MARRRKDFSEDIKNKVLLWCERHCCLCGRSVGVHIEVAHIDETRADLDNAIPLCFDCHAAVGHYNASHPRGRRYSELEQRSRRDQVFDEHTRKLVPPVRYEISQRGLKLPEVGFSISNLGSTWPVRVRVKLEIIQGSRSFGPPRGRHYDGRYWWNLNPQFAALGHFKLPSPVLISSGRPVKIRCELTLKDVYEREHHLLPSGYILNRKREWYFEPADEALLPKPKG